jgi:hypothetical protein
LFEEKLKLALVRLVGLGGLSVSVTTGLTVSIDQAKEADPLMLPAVSNARTKNVCGPSASGPTTSPLEQAEKESSSTWHSKLVAPAELKVKDVVELPTLLGCGSMVGWSGVVPPASGTPTARAAITAARTQSRLIKRRRAIPAA